MKVLAYTYSIAQENCLQIISVFVVACFILLFLYGLNVYSVISHTVSLQTLQKQTTTLTTAVNDLDSKYLQLANKVSPDALKDYGFTQGQVSAYISRTTSLGSVAIRAHEL